MDSKEMRDKRKIKRLTGEVMKHTRRDAKRRSNALYRRAKFYVTLKRYTKALHDFNDAIKLKPKNHKLFYNRGRLYVLMRKSRMAESDFTRVTELKNNYEKGHNALGKLYYSQRKIENSLMCFEKAIEINPEFSEGFNNIGIVQMENFEDYPKALEFFSKAIAADSYNLDSIVKKAKVLLLMKELNKSYDFVCKALKIIRKLEDDIRDDEDRYTPKEVAETRRSKREVLNVLKYLNMGIQQGVYENVTTERIVGEVVDNMNEKLDEITGKKRKREVEEVDELEDILKRTGFDSQYYQKRQKID